MVFFQAEIFITLCLLATSVYGVPSDRTRTRIPMPVDCQKMVQAAPANTPWVPQCDSSNRLLPMQVKKDGSAFCVDIYVASVLLEQTGTTEISCACMSEAEEMRRNTTKPLYVPECDRTTGSYQPKQCNRRGDCWCVDTVNGQQLGPRWGNKTSLSAVAASRDPIHLTVNRSEPRLSCDFLAKYWNKWNSRSEKNVQ